MNEDKKMYYELLRRLLEFFLKAKNDMVKDFTGIDIFDEEDYKDVLGWPDGMISVFFTVFEISDEAKDIIMCPWCVHFSNKDCVGCGYKERNGRCMTTTGLFVNKKSRYGRIIHTLGGFGLYSIYQIEGIEGLRNMILRLYNKIRKGDILSGRDLEDAILKEIY